MPGESPYLISLQRTPSPSHRVQRDASSRSNSAARCSPVGLPSASICLSTRPANLTSQRQGLASWPWLSAVCPRHRFGLARCRSVDHGRCGQPLFHFTCVPRMPHSHCELYRPFGGPCCGRLSSFISWWASAAQRGRESFDADLATPVSLMTPRVTPTPATSYGLECRARHRPSHARPPHRAATRVAPGGSRRRRVVWSGGVYLISFCSPATGRRHASGSRLCVACCGVPSGGRAGDAG